MTISSYFSNLPKFPTHFYELSAEKEVRLRKLYRDLDVNNDGTVDIRDLTLALREISHLHAKYAPKLMKRLDLAKDDTIDFSEFVHYVLEHEKKLALVFKELDKNADGYIDVREIKNYCQELGIPITDEKAKFLIKKMDKTGTTSIDLSEFRDYMLFYPSSDPKDIIEFWRLNLVMDIGEDIQVLEDFTQEELQTGIWWRHLIAGGIAGCMSRTVTAPLDRIKIYLQVNASKENHLRLQSAIRVLLKEGGLRSFWRGNGINVVKLAPESAIKFMAYEQMKQLIRLSRTDGNGKELSIFERFLAGSSAGVISQTSIYPMEVIKTRLVLRKTGELDQGLINFGWRLFQTEGLSCLFKGYFPNLIGIIPYAGIDLAIYETLKMMYIKKRQVAEPGILALLACGTCSCTCGQLSSYPLALVRTRLQAGAISSLPNQPKSMLGQFRHIFNHEGLSGLYRGLVPNFLKVVPSVGISYVVYENVRKQLGANIC